MPRESRPTVDAPVAELAFVGKGLLALAVLFTLQVASAVLLPVAMAVMLTFVLAGPVRRLRQWGIPEVFGAALVLVTLLGGIGLLVSVLARPAVEWSARAPTDLKQLMESVDRLRSTIPLLAPPPAPAAPVSRVGPVPPVDPIKEKLTTESVNFTRAIVAQLGSFVIQAAATLILLYFLLISERWMITRTVETIPRPRARGMLLASIRDAQREIGQFLATMTMINVGLGVFTALVLALVDMPNPPLWGTIAAVLNYIPYLGPLLTMLMLLMAGILTFNTFGAMVAPAFAFVLVNLVESNLVTPFVVGRRLQLSQVAVFLSVLFWGWLWGIVGALLAVPIVLGLRTFCKRRKRYRLLCAFLNGDDEEQPTLRTLLRERTRRNTWLTRRTAPSNRQ